MYLKKARKIVRNLEFKNIDHYHVTFEDGSEIEMGYTSINAEDLVEFNTVIDYFQQFYEKTIAEIHFIS